MNLLIKILKIIWTSPNSLIGLVVGVLGLCFGGKAQLRQGCIEFYGGLVNLILSNIPIGGSTAAMTLGHTILGQNQYDLDRCREHEQVHVRQYERWGPFFLFAYLGWSAVLWMQKKDSYFDNPFEVEAYTIADPRTHSAPPIDPDESSQEIEPND